MTRPLRILVCEDSATFALGLKRFLEMDEDLEVLEVAKTGEQAVEAVGRLRPDLVTMDLDLPGMGGIRAVEKIMQSHPVPILVVSGHVKRGSDQAAQALSAGALEALPKSHIRVDDPGGPAAVAMRYRLRRLAAARVGEGESAPTAPVAALAGNGAVAIGVCASTGGPRALEIVLAALPADFPLPLLVVQHMTTGFTEGLTSWLDHRASLPVALVRESQPLAPGVWIAPDGAHLVMEAPGKLALDSEPHDGPHRPSGDVLLSSMAKSLRRAAVGVVLTGMGRDGARGVEAIRQAGGRAIAQDEASSAIFGMPRAAAEAGAVKLPIAEIAPALRRLVAREVVA